MKRGLRTWRSATREWQEQARDRRRLVDLQVVIGVSKHVGVERPNELAGQLSLLVNGAFVSSQVLSPDEAIPLLRSTAQALVGAARETSSPSRARRARR
jgi:hypothetical protein